jgi:hypothetical protein
MVCRVGTSRYRFSVSNPDHVSSGVAYALLDGLPVDHDAIPVADDGSTHEVTVGLGSAVPSALRSRLA